MPHTFWNVTGFGMASYVLGISLIAGDYGWSLFAVAFMPLYAWDEAKESAAKA